MGYSCSSMASFTLDIIQEYFSPSHSDNRLPSNAITRNDYQHIGFWERGRENADGAITGRCFKSLSNGTYLPCGSFRIEPDGTIKRFPLLFKRLWIDIRADALARYNKIYGVPYGTRHDWTIGTNP